MPFCQQRVRHIRQHVEQHGVADRYVRIHDALYAEAQKAVRSHICMPVEKAAVRAHANGFQLQAEVAYRFPRVNVAFFLLIAVQFLFRKPV